MMFVRNFGEMENMMLFDVWIIDMLFFFNMICWNLCSRLCFHIYNLFFFFFFVSFRAWARSSSSSIIIR